MKPKPKFSPTSIGLKRKKVNYDDIIYEHYDKNNKLLGHLTFHDSLCPQYWIAFKKIYVTDDRPPLDSLVYQGQIKDNAFAKQLIKSIF